MGREDPINRFSHKKKEEIAQGKKEGGERGLLETSTFSLPIFQNFPKKKWGHARKACVLSCLRVREFDFIFLRGTVNT